MHRLFSHRVSGFVARHPTRFWYQRVKPDQLAQFSVTKHALLNQKTFPEIINIIKNPDNPYPKNSAYFYAILECILEESSENSKIMMEHGEVIHVFLQ